MLIVPRKENKNAVISITGSVTGQDSVKLSKILRTYKESDCSRIIIDLKEVDQIDSNVLGGLIYHQLLLKKHNKKMVLLAPNDHLKELFAECSFEEVFEIIDEYPEEFTADN